MDALQSMPLWDHSLAQVQWGAVIGASLAAAVCDVRTRRIPNVLTGAVLGLGLAWAFWVGGLSGMAESIGGCIAVGGPFVVLWIFGGGGAGDAKLMGALGAWLGLANGLVALLAVLFWGAFLGVLLSLIRGRFLRLLGNLRDLAVFWVFEIWRGAVFSRQSRPPAIQGLPMPYGVSILCGVLTAAAGVTIWRT